MLTLKAKHRIAKRIIPAYLNLKNPFNFDKELQTYKGKKASSGYAPDAVAFMNFADKFPGIAKNITVDVLEKDSDTYKALPLSEFSKAFKDVIENKEFEYQEIKNEYSETETLVLADPQQHEYEYNGKTHKYKDYGFEKRFWGKPNELDVAYEYLSSSVYSRIDMYSKTRLILDNNKEFTNALKDMGYDGAIQSEYGDEAVAFDSEQIKSAEPVTYDDNGNVIPLSERFNEKNDDIRYSLKDSEGNTLSGGQQEYFKDSKVRDENGNLKVVYHGTRKADFTVFKRNINFFTDNKEMADSYAPNGEMYEGYLNITKPYEIDAKGGKWSKIPIDEATKQFLEGYGAGVFKEGGKWRTTPADIASAIEEAVDHGEMDYDGIIIKNIDDTGSYYKGKEKNIGTDYIVFGSNPFKDINNINPSSDPDINRSLKGGMSSSELRENLSKYAKEGTLTTEKYNELIKTYGTIKKGEKPHRDVTVPTKTAEDKKVSQTVRTILEAEVTPDEAVPTIEKMVEDGVFSYDVYTDKEAIGNGEAYIKEHGWEQSLIDWFEAVNSGEVSKDTTTTGWILYNHAANSGDAKTAIMILDAMVRHQRSAAQALQATRILKKLSPEAQLYGIQKSVSAYQKELIDKYGKKAPDLKIDEELVEKFLTAEDEDARLEAEAEIYIDIGRQMPSDWLDKWNAWRYLAMLGNLRTHGRNILGNAFFAPVVATKNLTATVIESLVAPAVRLSGREMLRSKSIVWGSKADQALLKAAFEDYAVVADIVSNGGKYNDAANPNKFIEKGKKVFKSKAFAWLEWLRKTNSNLLEMEDVWFSKPHYAYALAMYCKANNISADQIVKGAAIGPAREYAIKEAQKATYKDTNAFSQFISELGRNGNKKNAFHKAAGVVVEGVLPFRKTPANILVRGVEYSPLSIFKILFYDIAKVKSGEMNAHELIDDISAGLTGSGLVALGIIMAAQCLVRGHGEDDKEEKKLKEMQGHQSYSLELPTGESVTLDWLAPEALPFFVGVNLWETLTDKATGEKLNMADLIGIVTRIGEPMIKMSCLQGINDMVESVKYAFEEESGGMTVLSSAVTSYLMQALPTLGGQLERTLKEERMDNFTNKDDFLTPNMQRALGKASAKIPFWDYNQIPYIDAWGRKEASGSALKRFGHNFLNPAYTSKIESTEMEEELLRLFDKTGEASVFPKRADKKITVDGEDKYLTAEEYVKYAELKGQKSYKLITELVESDAYKSLDDEGKVRAIQDAYDYANQKAKQTISNYKPQKWVEKADKFGNDADKYITFRSAVSETKKANDDDITRAQVADIINNLGVNDEQAWDMYLTQYNTSKSAVEVKDQGVAAKDYMEYMVGIEKAQSDDKLERMEVVDVISKLGTDDDTAWALYFSNNNYDGKSALYAKENGIGGNTYMAFLDALTKADKPSKNGNYGSYTQAETTEAVRSLEGLTNEERAALWQSVNTTWKSYKNPWR